VLKTQANVENFFSSKPMGHKNTLKTRQKSTKSPSNVENYIITAENRHEKRALI
jgi:hypothetical protein